MKTTITRKLAAILLIATFIITGTASVNAYAASDHETIEIGTFNELVLDDWYEENNSQNKALSETKDSQAEDKTEEFAGLFNLSPEKTPLLYSVKEFVMGVKTFALENSFVVDDVLEVIHLFIELVRGSVSGC